MQHVIEAAAAGYSRVIPRDDPSGLFVSLGVRPRLPAAESRA
jgi:hypothetical protein